MTLKPTKALRKNILDRALRVIKGYASQLQAGSTNTLTGKWDSSKLEREYDSLIALIGSLRNLRRSL